jgi:hypothetical protein
MPAINQTITPNSLWLGPNSNLLLLINCSANTVRSTEKFEFLIFNLTTGKWKDTYYRRAHLLRDLKAWCYQKVGHLKDLDIRSYIDEVKG